MKAADDLVTFREMVKALAIMGCYYSCSYGDRLASSGAGREVGMSGTITQDIGFN